MIFCKKENNVSSIASVAHKGEAMPACVEHLQIPPIRIMSQIC